MPRSGSLTDPSGCSIDNLVLTRLAAEWSSILPGARLTALRQEDARRFRLVVALDGAEISFVASLDPARPWLAVSSRRWVGPLWSPSPWVATVARELVGRRIESIDKKRTDRTVQWRFSGGKTLVFELTPGRADLSAVDEQGSTTGSLRQRDRAGRSAAPARIDDRVDPFTASVETLDRACEGVEIDALPAELRRRFLGLSETGAELAVRESLATGSTVGTILKRRLDSVAMGASELVIESAGDARSAGGERLLPWRPSQVPSGRTLIAREPASSTAGRFFEQRDEVSRAAARIEGLGRILKRQSTRTFEAAARVRADLEAFENPDRHRAAAEALLAGLSVAERTGDSVIVPDPYATDGRRITIAAPRERTLAGVADDLFRKHRRAVRGLESARRRLEVLEARSARLDELLLRHERTSQPAEADELEAAMRDAGIPVGLSAGSRAKRTSARATAPVVSGVRMVSSTEGWTILIGKSGPDNDRLTFKIAAPDDFWLHAEGVAGAHVVIRNLDGRPKPPGPTLHEAAAYAIWFSDARSQGAGDVHWTRCKYVRRAKGGAGKVLLKRFETIRAKAKAPPTEA